MANPNPPAGGVPAAPNPNPTFLQILQQHLPNQQQMRHCAQVFLILAACVIGSVSVVLFVCWFFHVVCLYSICSNTSDSYFFTRALCYVDSLGSSVHQSVFHNKESLKYGDDDIRRAAFILERELSKMVGDKQHGAFCNGGKSDVAVSGGVQQYLNYNLELYRNDKTGLVDYASEHLGAVVLESSATYNSRNVKVKLFGIPLWYLYQGPQKMLQPDMQPGNCWVMKNTFGYAIIELTHDIYIHAVSLEHIPKRMTMTGDVKTAPKAFSVSGLKSLDDKNGVELINGEFSANYLALQFFCVDEHLQKERFKFVKLQIHSNYGHDDYTCIYRFRVHGKINEEPPMITHQE